MRLAALLSLVALAACDSGPADDSAFARLQGTWAETGGDETVRYGPGQAYRVTDVGRGAPQVVEEGLYGTLTGDGDPDSFTVRTMPDGGAAFYDEAAELDGDRLRLTGEDGGTRRYRRVE